MFYRIDNRFAKGVDGFHGQMNGDQTGIAVVLDRLASNPKA